MKCPKCGYLGFETTDRCRNCGYDFSLTSPGASPELPLRAGAADGPLAELTLQHETSTVVASDAAVEAGGLDVFDPGPAPLPPGDLEAPLPARSRTPRRDQAPVVSPPPAGNPLAVRRASPDGPRVRRSTTRPARLGTPSLPLSPDATEPAADSRASRETTLVPASMPARLGAALIDLGLLGGIDAAIVWLTLRMAGLDVGPANLLLIRPIPMVAFLLLLAFMYLAGFTLGGGQTIGKMTCGVRVIGDDGRSVDAAGAVVRAAGWLVTAGTLGLLYLPALFHAERRAPHDRLAGTRVVKA
jgi:uncharacterized RDD family membrane protein YckC